MVRKVVRTSTKTGTPRTTTPKTPTKNSTSGLLGMTKGSKSYIDARRKARQDEQAGFREDTNYKIYDTKAARRVRNIEHGTKVNGGKRPKSKYSTLLG